MPASRRVFRVVRSDPPIENDFAAQMWLGRKYVDDAAPDLRSGVSVFATAAQAARVARRYQMGNYVAELLLPEEGVEIRRTGRARGHHTVWASPDVLLRSVTHVRRVE